MLMITLTIKTKPAAIKTAPANSFFFGIIIFKPTRNSRATQTTFSYIYDFKGGRDKSL